MLKRYLFGNKSWIFQNIFSFGTKNA